MLHRISISDFKSLVDVTVELEPVTVLVGRSGTGKSNFIGAIQFLRDFLRQGSKVVQRGNWQGIAPAMNPKRRPGFDIEFSVAGLTERFHYKLALSERPDVPSEESLSLGGVVLFHQRQSKWDREPNVVQLPQPSEVVIRNIPSISEVVIAFTALTEGIGCYVLPPTVLLTGDAKGKGLRDDAGNFLATLRDIASDLQNLHTRRSIVAALSRLNSTVTSVELDSILTPQKIVVGHQINGKTLSLNLAQESDGFRRFYAHLLALYQRPPKQTLMFEEPENGIYPGALALLADEFKAAPAASRGQVILTTHSPRLLDHFNADAIRVVEMDNFETRISKISKSQREALNEQLVDPGELLTVDPARSDAAEAAAE